MDTRAFDPVMIFTVMPDLLEYLDVTLLVGAGSIIGGSLLGMLLAWAKIGGTRGLRWLAQGYTYVMRCTPSIVLLFIVFYGLPQLMDALFSYNINQMNRAVFAILTFVLLFGAYISEVFRSAYLAVPQGQYEAAVSIGIPPIKAFFLVMLPQAAVVALPNFANSTINLLKEGALAYTIGLIDMIGQGNLIIAQNFGAYGIEVYTACMLIYWGMTLLLERVFDWLEARLDKGQTLAIRSKDATGKEKNGWKEWLKGGEAHGIGL
ncbi:amino acid ABC transporter permease [Selenomonas caprae]|uniref:Amino acid ABC transporter permease n=1 Tax=Selenomonas caprae TaxID=2606905 RepID=A0A5D6WR92_9FIRM|nr:amino acid ABC transporter permease [Selenomonas caprae]TYZ29438.1 amino acid ABC transporter permease [Selenomonas caprae]